MKTLSHRLTGWLASPRVAYGSFAILAVLTAVGLAETEKPESGHTAIDVRGGDGLTLTGKLSRTKLVQGEAGTVYLDLAIEAPAAAGLPRRATDLIVVLDHSGSMAAENRLPFAKKAIVDLLGRLDERDRFGLVVFDSEARVVSGLAPVDAALRGRLIQALAAIQPGSGTNLGAGVLEARALAEREGSERHRRVLLLSDGQANEGITHPAELAALARAMGGQGLTLSTIGMGLDFNQTLMASLADQGMGSYAYLEHLGGLTEILSRSLDATRRVYADRSALLIHPGPGVELVEAGGYPIEVLPNGVLRVPTGAVLSGQRRGLSLVFKTPTADLGARGLATVSLQYQTAGGPAAVDLAPERLAVAVLPPEAGDVAKASVDASVVQSIWRENNLGKLKGAYADAVASGERDKAKEAIAAYKRDTADEEAALGVSIVDDKTRSELQALEGKLENAFAGPAAEQPVKQNRLAKEAHAAGLEAQRRN